MLRRMKVGCSLTSRAWPTQQAKAVERLLSSTAGEVVGTWGRTLPTVALWSPRAHLCKSTLAVKIQKVSTQKFQVSKTNKIHNTPPQGYRSPTGPLVEVSSPLSSPMLGEWWYFFVVQVPLTVLEVTSINLLAHRIGFGKIVGALSDVNRCVYISPGSHIISYMYAHACTHTHPPPHTHL